MRGNYGKKGLCKKGLVDAMDIDARRVSNLPVRTGGRSKALGHSRAFRRRGAVLSHTQTCYTMYHEMKLLSPRSGTHSQRVGVSKDALFDVRLDRENEVHFISSMSFSERDISFHRHFSSHLISQKNICRFWRKPPWVEAQKGKEKRRFWS